MNNQEKIIKNYPLTNKVECDYDCYLVDKKRYIVFWEGLVEKKSIGNILDQLKEKTNTANFTEWKTLIVIGNTRDVYKKEELFYFDNVSTFIIFYLINEESNIVYMNDSWIFALGCNYKKHVRRINKFMSVENVKMVVTK